MTTPLDLCEPRALTMQKFCWQVADLAVNDHLNNVRRRTGRQICETLTDGYRLNHVRLASTIYNKTRWSFEAAEREQEEAAGDAPCS